MSTEDTSVQATTDIPDSTAEETQEKGTKLEDLDKTDLIEIARNLRKENAAKRVKTREAEQELEEFRKWKESQKTELEKAQERAETLQKQNFSLLRTSIALSAGLGIDDVEFISGETEEEMKASAQKLATRVKTTEKVKPPVTDVFAGSRGTPVNSGPTDTKALANQWLANLVFNSNS